MNAALLVVSLLLSAEPPRRAVVVGSNAAIEGRGALRFSHADANAMAEVLRTSGGFREGDVKVLLDAKPAEVLRALDALSKELGAGDEHGLLLFYYSGHADQHALYPGGEKLELEALKARLGDERVGVRIGIIDACRGGGWTQAKGLTPTTPFAVGLPSLSSEGTALLAASSGLEDAHEAEGLQGSFFTHHLIAGLRGAADATGDGQVTLSEAFAYANRLTIRDTARRSKEPQHPSFDLRLRGRQDVVLTSVADGDTQLLVAQDQGPLEVVQLSTGVTVAEATPGGQLLRLALTPGPYLVRRVKDGQVFSREVMVKAGQSARLEESSLTLVGQQDPGGAKGVTDNGPLHGQHALTLSGGVAPFDSFIAGFSLSADYTWFFSKLFGWRVLHATYYANLERELTAQLIRDFGILPSAFISHEGVAHTSFVFEPVLVEGAGTLFRGGFLAGPGVTMSRVWGGGIATAERRFRPALVFGVEAHLMFARLGPVGGGLRLAVNGTLEFGPERLHNVLWFTAGAELDLGPRR